MSLPSTTKIWIKRILKWALIIEVAYVVLLNSILQLPLTQTLINQIRPEKFYISWENAWTPYPFRVHVSGGYANGNSRSQIWAFEADSVSGSIAVLPLIFKRVWVRRVAGVNLDFQLRPRTKPDRDFSQVSPYFPVIEGR